KSGGGVRTRCGIAAVRFSNAAVASLQLDDGTEVAADYYVFAVPFDRLLKLFPADVQQEQVFVDLQNLRVSPITSVHLWFNQRVMTEPFVTLVDGTSQWIFNRSDLCHSSTEEPGQYLQVVISASHDLASRSQQEIIDMCLLEVHQAIPATTTANL